MFFDTTPERSWHIVAHSPDWVSRLVRSLRSAGKRNEIACLSGEECFQAPSLGMESQGQEPSLHQSPEAVIGTKTTSALMQLPDELLVEILRHLPLSSLYMVHQTCRTLRSLVDDSALKEFRLEFLHPEGESFSMARTGFEQRLAVRDTILRRSLCDTCTRLADTGELARRMKSLYEPLYCSGCRQDHPALFFPPGQKGKTRCLGLLGRFSLCGHLTLSGKHAERTPQNRLWREMICNDTAHSPLDLGDPNDRFMANQCCPRIVPVQHMSADHVSAIKAVVLLHLDHSHDISMDRIRQHLAAQLDNSQQLCKHISSQVPQLLDSLVSDECECFPTTGVPMGWWTESPQCLGEHRFTCQDCGAEYSWVRQMDRKNSAKSCVVLYMSMTWPNDGPLGFGWLSNLDFKGKRNPVLCEKTKGVLWCDKPGCGTGTGLRWLRMAKTFAHEVSEGDAWDDLNSKGTGFERIRPFSREYEAFQEFSEGYRLGGRQSIYCRQWRI